MAELSRFGVSAEEELLVSFDELIAAKGYENRSEALRDLMREALIRSKLEDHPESEAIGSLTLVYDHHAGTLLGEMAGIQHDFHSLIISVMHLHVSHEDCLEILAIRGKVANIVKLSNALLSLKGIKNGKLFLTLPSSAIANSN